MRSSATTAGAGAFAIENVPEHDYPSFVFKAAGYDQLVTAVPVQKAASRPRSTARLRRNWASASGGASSAGDEHVRQPRLRDQRRDRPEPRRRVVDGRRRLAPDDRDPAAERERHRLRDRPDRGVRGRRGRGCAADRRSRRRRTDGQLRRRRSTTDLPFTDDHAVTTLAPPPARAPMCASSASRLLSNFGGAFFDLSEFSVYAGPAASVDVTAAADPDSRDADRDRDAVADRDADGRADAGARPSRRRRRRRSGSTRPAAAPRSCV